MAHGSRLVAQASCLMANVGTRALLEPATPSEGECFLPYRSLTKWISRCAIAQWQDWFHGWFLVNWESFIGVLAAVVEQFGSEKMWRASSPTGPQSKQPIIFQMKQKTWFLLHF